MQFLGALRELLIGALEGNLPNRDLTRLVQICRSVVEAYLAHYRSSVVHICAATGMSINDLALDSIAEVFGRDENGDLWRLREFVSSLDDDINNIPELDLWLAFKAYLIRIAEAQLARLYAQVDPAGAKIHRNLRDCLQNFPTLRLTKKLRGLTITPAREDTLEHLPPFPDDEFESRFHAIVKKEPSISDLLKALHYVLATQKQYRRLVLLTDFVQVARKVYVGTDVTSETVELDLGGLSPRDVEQICRYAELAVKERIMFTYYAHGKLDKAEAEALARAFGDIISDWSTAGRLEASLFNYVRRHLSVSEDLYEREYRSKTEYLLKIAREEIAARLMKEL
ncbi:MAG TPA: hypothetical protein VNL36_03585 [Bacteroidota bacterium]|nr:hypothetical protein [Bacteroidota bacterium]